MGATKICTSYENEPLYTYTEWQRIERNAQKKRRAERRYFAKQKIAGVLLLIMGVVAPFFCDGDATCSLILLPAGLYCFFTKEKVMTF